MSQTAETEHRVSEVKPESLAWVERLVSIDTISRNPNLGLIETVRDELKKAGIEATITTDPRGGEWANLFATVPAHNGDTHGGIVLSGHTDVVPVDGQDWKSDPFKPEIRDDLLYGRGTCDMKGFIGATLTMLPQMQSMRLAKPIYFALSYDEEVSCAGAPLMIADLQKRGLKPDGCIVGEPTSMRPVIAHKGHQHVSMLRARLRGAFVADAQRPQRHRVRGTADLPHPRSGRRVPRARPL